LESLLTSELSQPLELKVLLEKWIFYRDLCPLEQLLWLFVPVYDRYSEPI
jgi:hypothetical protein